MSIKNIKWLENELPQLVNQKIISPEQQSAISEFYENKKKNSSNPALIAFSIFGAILLGTGIILILANNWATLSRPTRTALSFLPLITGQAIGFWVALKRRHSIAWSEGIATFIFLAIGSTIALISQTYHIQGEVHSFLLTWMLLVIPLMYIFSSTTVSVLYLIGISSWAISAIFGNLSSNGYWLLLLAVFPTFLLKNKRGENSMQSTVIAWFTCLSLIIGVSVGHNSITEGFRVISFISLFLSFYLAGLIFDTETSFWSNPFHRIGITGLAITYLFLSYRGSWNNLSYEVSTHNWRDIEISIGDWIISIGLPVITLLLFLLTLKNKKKISLPIAIGIAIGLPVALLGFFFTDSNLGQTIFTAFFNIYVFIGGIAYLLQGIKVNESKTVNFGFALVTSIIALRFFDSNLSFILRGIIFIILGAGFLATNILIAKRRTVK